MLMGLDFIDSALGLRYRASDEPQQLWVEVDVDGQPSQPFAGGSMRLLVDGINDGIAGGDLFAPTLPKAKILQGPTPEEAAGSRYRWTLEVSAVAPSYMVSMVAELRRAGFDRFVSRMSIVGSVAPDETEASVREEEVRRSLQSPSPGHLRAWPRISFPVTALHHPSGLMASLRLEFADPIDKPFRRALEQFVMRWVNSLRNTPDDNGEEVFFNPHRMLPYFGQSPTEFSVRLPEFRYEKATARAAILNMLERLHASGTPVLQARVEV